MGEIMKIKKLACGLLLSGVIGVAPAMAQSALAQQNTAQPSGAQQDQKSSQAKPAAKTTTAAKPAASPTGTKPATAAKTSAKTTAAKPTAPATAAATAKKGPPKPVVYIDNPTSKPADVSTSKSANDSTDKSTKPTVVKASDTPAKQKPQNADVVKAFQQNCPGIALSEDKKKAGYNVAFEREPGSKGVKTAFGLTNTVRKTNRIEVTTKSGKEVFSETGHSTSQMVKDACAAIEAPAATKIAKK
jgi:hypothetical protein